MVLYLHENDKMKYARQLVDYFNELNRNWELMQLQFVPYKQIVKEVMRLN